MLKQTRKKKAAKFHLPDSPAEQVVCAACHHVREQTATHPDWQCPGCGAAYAKVNHKPARKHYTRKELEEKNREYLRKQREGHDGNPGPLQDPVTKAGLTIGSAALGQAMARTVTTCAGLKSIIPANPALLAAGAVILLGTLAYVVYKALS